MAPCVCPVVMMICPVVMMVHFHAAAEMLIVPEPQKPPQYRALSGGHDQNFALVRLTRDTSTTQLSV